MILNTETQSHRVIPFVCGEAADSVPSPSFFRQTVTKLCVSVLLCLIETNYLKEKPPESLTSEGLKPNFQALGGRLLSVWKQTGHIV